MRNCKFINITGNMSWILVCFQWITAYNLSIRANLTEAKTLPYTENKPTSVSGELLAISGHKVGSLLTEK